MNEFQGSPFNPIATRYNRSACAEIMIVDDNPENLRLLVEILLQQGHRVRPTTEGTLAIAAATLQPPDIILLDIKMPTLDGYEVCRQIKALPQTQDIPIMFLTVLDEPIDKVKGFAIGGVDYITKPFNASELLARIDHQIRLSFLQKKLIEQEQFLRSIYNGVNISIAVIDVFSREELQIVAVNKSFLDLFEVDRCDVEGAPLGQVLDSKSIHVQIQQCLETELAVTQEHAFERESQTLWWISTFSPMCDDLGNVYRLIGTGLNITDRKQAEMELARSSAELCQTLKTLKSTQAELVRSAKMAALGSLVAGVAHEINTPVGSAIMMASTLDNATQTMKEDVEQGKLTQQAFQQYLEVAADASRVILDNLNRAGELVQSFKLVAVDQTSLKARTFSVKPYVEGVITSLLPQIKQTPHHIDLCGDDHLKIHSDPGALSQVITNLVLNSLKHAFTSDRSGKITISVFWNQEDVVLTYDDNGRGIAPEHLDKIFEPFFTTTRHQGGSGLGLHLTYNLVTQRLRGTITVNSTLGQGTQFVLHLPPNIESLRS